MLQKYEKILKNTESIFTKNKVFAYTLKDKTGEEIFSTYDICTNQSGLIASLLASLEFCQKFRNYASLDLLAKAINNSILQYKQGKLDVNNKTKPIKMLCKELANDKYDFLSERALQLFYTYYNHSEKDITNCFLSLCALLEIDIVNIEKLLPNYKKATKDFKNNNYNFVNF